MPRPAYDLTAAGDFTATIDLSAGLFSGASADHATMATQPQPAVASDGTSYWAYALSSDPVGTAPQVRRLAAASGPSSTTLIVAGNGTADPATGAENGTGTDMPLSPAGLAVDSTGNLLISSGHVVYSLTDPGNIAPPSS